MAKNNNEDFNRMWEQQLDFVEEALKDKKIPASVKSILEEWLADRGKELLNDKDINPNKR